MKIHIHYEVTDKPWGGINSFFKAFQDYLKKNKKDEISFAKKLRGQYDILFMGSFVCGIGGDKKINYKQVRKISEKKRIDLLGKLFGKQLNNCKIIHRLDGLKSKYANNDSLLEFDLNQYKLSLLSDWVIFQSHYSLNCFESIGYSGKNYSIIYNGVNQRIFNSKNKAYWNGKAKLKVLSTSWSPNIRKGFDIISLVSRLEDLESIFVGNWCKETDPGNVHIFPPVKQEELAAYYKECDVLLFPSKNEACPNVVLEALSCGLPIIYHNSGGTPEIAGKYGISLPNAISKETLLVTLEKIKANYHNLVNQVKHDMKVFSIDHAAEQYLNVFEEVLNRD